MSTYTIGLTRYDNPKFRFYTEWLEEVPGVKVQVLDYDLNNLSDVDRCDGIVFSGGEDVSPSFYGKAEYATEPLMGKLNEVRDKFELAVMRRAEEKQLPVLGICRGHQFINAYYGGTLFFDMNEQKATATNHRSIDGVDEQHSTKTVAGTLLQQWAGNEGHINSSHHQSIDRLAPALTANTFSPDGIIEGCEWKDKNGKPFLLTVQWHPERMPQRNENPFSKNIREAFIQAVAKHKSNGR